MRKHWLEISWGVFSAANVAFMLVVPGWETIPFHFVWVSLTLLYGYRVWKARTTGIVLGAVIVSTAIALGWTVKRGEENVAELAEVPLMAAMFLAMAWHAHRRQRAVEEASRAAETERRVLKRQREFVRDASHELRTPITVARGHAELVRSQIHDEESAGDIDVILDELGRLAKLSDRLLTLAGVDHPDFLSISPVWVDELVEETVRRWRPAADRDWLATVEANGWIDVDRERLEAALDAVIENSVRATGTGARIQIWARAEGEALVLGISDEGRGIDQDDLPRVFERFFRSESHRGRENGGTGLGLAIVGAIVEAHGGTIQVSSRPEGGTSVAMRLPTYRETGRDRGATPPPVFTGSAEPSPARASVAPASSLPGPQAGPR